MKIRIRLRVASLLHQWSKFNLKFNVEPIKREIIGTNKPSMHERISEIQQLKVSRNQQKVNLIKFSVERPSVVDDDLFSPFLEQSHALASAVGAPEVAAA